MGEDLRQDGGDPAGGGGRERKREREFDDRNREPRDLRVNVRQRLPLYGMVCERSRPIYGSIQ